MHHILINAAWLIGSLVVGFTAVQLTNKHAKAGCYSDYSNWQKKRTRHD